MTHPIDTSGSKQGEVVAYRWRYRTSNIWNLVADDPTSSVCQAPEFIVECLVVASAPSPALREALGHRGNVLYFGAAIHPDDRNDAFENALEFYNAAYPEKQVDGVEHAEMRTIFAALQAAGNARCDDCGKDLNDHTEPHQIDCRNRPSDTPVSLPAVTDEPVAVITYKNWRGEVAERRIIPKSVHYGSTEWHPEPQWLLRAWDDEKQSFRDFALKDFGASPAISGVTVEEIVRSFIELLFKTATHIGLAGEQGSERTATAFRNEVASKAQAILSSIGSEGGSERNSTHKEPSSGAVSDETKSGGAG